MGWCLLIVKKVFDTVDQAILITNGLNGVAIRIFRSYLENRSQSCLVNGHLSHKLPKKCGVP